MASQGIPTTINEPLPRLNAGSLLYLKDLALPFPHHSLQPVNIGIWELLWEDFHKNFRQLAGIQQQLQTRISDSPTDLSDQEVSQGLHGLGQTLANFGQAAMRASQRIERIRISLLEPNQPPQQGPSMPPVTTAPEQPIPGQRNAPQVAQQTEAQANLAALRRIAIPPMPRLPRRTDPRPGAPAPQQEAPAAQQGDQAAIQGPNSSSRDVTSKNPQTPATPTAPPGVHAQVPVSTSSTAPNTSASTELQSEPVTRSRGQPVAGTRRSASPDDQPRPTRSRSPSYWNANY